MPAHSIGSATISFGLVSVPIKMFSAGESSAAISFNWLHKKDGDRAFTLLGEALKKTRKVAIGQWAARGKQYLVMIRPLGRGLAMEQLRYANEVRSIDEVPIPKVDVKKAELDMAVQLIEQAAI